MINFIVEQYKESKILKLVSVFFVLLSIWWLSMYLRGLTEGPENDLYILIYPFLSLIGGVYGWVFASKWGGFKSTFGSAIALFSLGLLAQFGGQMLYDYYQLYLHVEVPYPSIGDISYFLSVIFYILGVYQLARVSGLSLSMQSLQGKLKAIIIPLIVVGVSYIVLLQDYSADWSHTMVVLLDFGYPVAQAIYLSIAILALLISKDILGGLMRKPIMLLIAALSVQFLCDFVFSYQVSREVSTFYAAGTNDYMFTVSYLLMTLALFSIGNMFYKVQES